MQPCPELLDDLLVGSIEGGLGRFRLTASLDVLHGAKQHLHGFEVALGGAVDELLDNGLALADLSPSAVLSDDNLFVERVVDQG
jgi:hypothetical protein